MADYFADTGYWLALLDIEDDLYSKANQWAEIIEAESTSKIYTTDLVLAELLNSKPIYANSHIRVVAAELIIEIRASEEIKVIGLTGEAFGAALLRYKTYRDKEWSLTDCLSFVVMEQHHITVALTHDHHFIQAGFRALMREDS
jgi:predicted nucleic acid-binding protein